MARRATRRSTRGKMLGQRQAGFGAEGEMRNLARRCVDCAHEVGGGVHMIARNGEAPPACRRAGACRAPVWVSGSLRQGLGGGADALPHA